ncbi:MAG TPA: PaaI family thioesterase [Actinomycetota bacterium]
MTIASTILDQIVDGTGEPPPMVTTLKLPPIEGWEPGRVWGTWTVDPAFFHAMGAVFGGYLAALADSFVSLAMFSTMPDDEVFTTADLRVSFFRPVSVGTLTIVAEVLHRGKRMAHVEAVFVDQKDKIAVKATATKIITPLVDPELSGSGG